MKRDDPTRPDQFDTLPDGTAAQPPSVPAPNPKREVELDSGDTEPPTSGEARDKNFWRLDFHTIPPDLSRELATTELPPVREDQLYQPHAWAEKSKPHATAPRRVDTVAVLTRIRAWFGRRWHWHERRTQLVLAFCGACLILFLVAVGLQPSGRGRAAQQPVGAPQVQAASPRIEATPSLQTALNTAGVSALATEASARQSPHAAPVVSSIGFGGNPGVRARTSAPAGAPSAKSTGARESRQPEQDIGQRAKPTASDQTPEPSDFAEPVKSPMPSASPSSTPKQHFLIKSR